MKPKNKLCINLEWSIIYKFQDIWPCRFGFTHLISWNWFSLSIAFSKHPPSGPLLSISRFVHISVCLSFCLSVCLSVNFLRYRLNVFLPPLPKDECPKFLEIMNPWRKFMVRSGLRFKLFFLLINGLELPRTKKVCFWANFALLSRIFLGARVFHSVYRSFRPNFPKSHVQTF